jgi:hypothetical protein
VPPAPASVPCEARYAPSRDTVKHIEHKQLEAAQELLGATRDC